MSFRPTFQIHGIKKLCITPTVKGDKGVSWISIVFEGEGPDDSGKVTLFGSGASPPKITLLPAKEIPDDEHVGEETDAFIANNIELTAEAPKEDRDDN